MLHFLPRCCSICLWFNSIRYDDNALQRQISFHFEILPVSMQKLIRNLICGVNKSNTKITVDKWVDCVVANKREMLAQHNRSNLTRSKWNQYTHTDSCKIFAHTARLILSMYLDCLWFRMFEFDRCCIRREQFFYFEKFEC